MFIKQYKSKYVIRISGKNFGVENSVKSVPLYAVWCLQPEIVYDENSTNETLLLSEKSLAEDWLSDEDNRWDDVL